MFKVTLTAVFCSLAAFAIGHYFGYKQGFTSINDQALAKASIFQSSTQMSYSFVPLRSVLANEHSNAINALNNTLIASINSLTESLDSSDEQPSDEIIEVINIITDWESVNEHTYENRAELSRALNAFNNKHNKSLQPTANGGG